VAFWLRNVAKHPQSFWLPTATGKFYPDFVARLKDDRLAVIEYKGALLAGAGVDDTNEKRAIGRLWEQASGGQGVFVMVEKTLGDRNMREQLQERLDG
jgi:type III restriction enzyme